MMTIKEKITPYLPGILLFVLAAVVGMLTYQDYGIAWDEPYQRGPGLLAYNYAFHGSHELFQKETDNHGAGFELLLLFFEKGLHITDTRDIYMNRHIVTNIFYLLSAFAGYVLILKLYKNQFLASLGFVILAFTPRLYAHSFFNSKDIPFMCMMLITLAVARAAFDKNKTWLYLLTGLACGYGTSIRIMGIMLLLFLVMFLIIDLINAATNKEQLLKPLLNPLVLFAGFCTSLYISWPYLWPAPIHNFVESFKALSHFKWAATTLIGGKAITATELPWTYLPTWFIITTPVLWLITGLAGIGFVVYQFFQQPMAYLRNTPERNLLLYVLCFFGPIFSVILLHSVVYDDWRHVFFIYPPFILLSLYFINRFINAKYKMIVQGVCALQVAVVLVFMIQNHPFHQVYFNELVSHEEQYLRKNYELDYWGLSYKQALDHILEVDNRKDINVCSNLSAYIENNTLGLREEDRKKIHFTPPDQADYFITNYRGHPEDYPGVNVDYSITVLNSDILQVFRLKSTQVKLR